MKYDKLELEMLTLAHITRNAKSMERLITRQVGAEHFDYISENDKISYTNALFKLIADYYKSSGGSLLTTYVLESKMIEHNVKDRSKAKLFTLWSEISDVDVDDNDFHEITSLLKNKHCNKIFSDMLTQVSANYDDGKLDSSLEILSKGLETISNEKNEIAADRHNFDANQSSTFFKEEYDKRFFQPELFKGINSGLSNIDSKTFGWLPGQIIVFLAPSSGGKSVMMLNAAMHANKQCNKNVLYMSFEMNSWLCLLRHISLSFEIPYSQLKDNNLSPDEVKNITDGLYDPEKAYFEYDVNMEDPTPEYIDSRIRDLIATKGKPDLLVVDYIGNMTVRNAPNGSKDWELQSKAITELFKMAKRYNIPIITAQQINRETIRDARKQKEANKFMSYDQAAASGGQVLLHLCTYAIAMEPNREKNYCILHPVKMRDAYFKPFPVAMDPEFNKVRELDPVEQETILSMHLLDNGANVSSTKKDNNPHVKTDGKTPINRPVVEGLKIEDDDDAPVNVFVDEEIDFADWTNLS